MRSKNDKTIALDSLRGGGGGGVLSGNLVLWTAEIAKGPAYLRRTTFSMQLPYKLSGDSSIVKIYAWSLQRYSSSPQQWMATKANDIFELIVLVLSLFS